MSSSGKHRRSKKSKSKKSQGTSVEPGESAISFDYEDDKPVVPKVLPFEFKPTSIKFRKKRSRVISNTSTNHRRSKSLPSIPIADEIYEAHPSHKLNKLTTICNLEDFEVVDYRAEDNSEDDLLQVWYEESYLEDLAYHSGDEMKPRMKSFAFADTNGDKHYLCDKILEPYASDTILRDPLTRPYFDAEYEAFKRQNWIQVSHSKATLMPDDRKIIFKVLTKNRPRHILTHLRLGFCVTYIGPCPFGQACQNSCSRCGICRHQYHCTCRNKKRFGWCWHMHAAILTVKYAFKEDLTVYVAISGRSMQLAHIRATCYDRQQNVNQLEENLFQVHEIASSAEPVHFACLVWRLVSQRRCKCSPYKRCPECNICRHMYSCNCTEYENGNLCEHCHLVAMHLSGCQPDYGEFYYHSDRSEKSDEDEQVPGKEAICESDKNKRQILMMHERSHGLSLINVDPFFERPDNQLCFTLYESGLEEPWFIENLSLNTCDCENSPEAVKCPFCRLCDHELQCHCFSTDGYSCKHLHAVRRFVNTHYNADADKRFENESYRKTPDRKLLEERQKREIKRQIRRNRCPPIQDIDLTWSGRKKSVAEIPQECTLSEPVVESEFSTEDILQGQSSSSKIVLQNETCLVEDGCQKNEKEGAGRDSGSSHLVGNVEIQLQVPVSGEKAVDDSIAKSETQNPSEVEVDPIISNSSSTDLNRNSVMNNDSQIALAPEGSTFEVADSKKVPPEINEFELQASQCIFENKVELDEKHVTQNVVIVNNLKEDIQLRSPVSDEKTVENSSAKSEMQNLIEVAKDPIISSNSLTDFFDRNPKVNNDLIIASAPECSQPSEDGSTPEVADFEGELPERKMSELPASHKSRCIFENEAKLEEKYVTQRVITENLKEDIQLSSSLTVKPNEEEAFQQNTCEVDLTVATVEQTGIESQSANDTPNSEITIDEPEIDVKIIKAGSNCTVDVSTQTDPENRISVSTQTSDIDFVD